MMKTVYLLKLRFARGIHVNTILTAEKKMASDWCISVPNPAKDTKQKRNKHDSYGIIHKSIPKHFGRQVSLSILLILSPTAYI